jgi:hypothetical protein
MKRLLALMLMTSKVNLTARLCNPPDCMRRGSGAER